MNACMVKTSITVLVVLFSWFLCKECDEKKKDRICQHFRIFSLCFLHGLAALKNKTNKTKTVQSWDDMTEHIITENWSTANPRKTWQKESLVWIPWLNVKAISPKFKMLLVKRKTDSYLGLNNFMRQQGKWGKTNVKCQSHSSVGSSRLKMGRDVNTGFLCSGSQLMVGLWHKTDQVKSVRDFWWCHFKPTWISLSSIWQQYFQHNLVIYSATWK